MLHVSFFTCLFLLLIIITIFYLLASGTVVHVKSSCEKSTLHNSEVSMMPRCD